MTELETVKDRIRKLSAQTVDRGCTENEANVAMKMIGKLLVQYNLNMSDIDLRNVECETVVVMQDVGNRPSYETFIVGVATFTDCKVWKNHSGGYSLYGFPEDTQMAAYLTNMILVAIENETKIFKNSAVYQEMNKTQHGKGIVSSFHAGMGSRLYRRLCDLKEENNKEVRSAETARAADPTRPTTGTSLVVVKIATVEEQFKKTSKFKLKKTYTKKRVSNYLSFHKGAEAGNKVNLNRPITNENVKAIS